jgi:hypothetical protein
MCGIHPARFLRGGNWLRRTYVSLMRRDRRSRVGVNGGHPHIGKASVLGLSTGVNAPLSTNRLADRREAPEIDPVSLRHHRQVGQHGKRPTGG